ncbi:MAG: hypothetical protein OXI67_16095 [Candidatus Poribacteria bacterium]|nr:hypothetical protein [Candidatus Poribacteria bacterium]
MIPNNEEIQKERYEQYLAEERKIFDSLLSNDVEFNRTMRYFSGGLLVLMTAYIDWNGVNNVIRFSTYTPFILSILSNIIAYVYVRKSLQKQSEFNEDYYINNIEAARFYESKSGKRGNRLIRLSIISFIVGMLIFLAFLGFGILKINRG